LYLDFSNKQKEENAINFVKFQELQKQLNDALIKNKILEDSLQNVNEEYLRSKQENSMLIEKINLKEKNLFTIQAEKKINEDNFNTKILEMQHRLEEKNKLCKELEDKNEKLEKDLKELV